MQALGMIETRGTLAAIEAVDVMLKAADVTLVEKTKIGGGLVTASRNCSCRCRRIGSRASG